MARIRAKIFCSVAQAVTFLWAVYSNLSTASNILSDTSSLMRLFEHPPLYLPWLAVGLVFPFLGWAFWPDSNGSEQIETSVNPHFISRDISHSHVGDVYNIGYAAASGNNKSHQLSEEQSWELRELNNFILRKDELSLRETFDFRGMLENNIRKAQIDLKLCPISKEEIEHVNNYFAGGQAMIDIRFANIYVYNNRANVEFIPGLYGSVNLPISYVQAKSKIERISNSALLPSSIKREIKEFIELIQTKATLVIECINHDLKLNPLFVSGNFKADTPYYMAATGTYWQRFGYLRPAVDRIAAAVEEFIVDV